VLLFFDAQLFGELGEGLPDCRVIGQFPVQGHPFIDGLFEGILAVVLVEEGAAVAKEAFEAVIVQQQCEVKEAGDALYVLPHMEGGLGVVAFAIGDDHIAITLHTGQALCFTYRSAGRANVEHMKLLTRFIYNEAKGKHEMLVAP